MTEIALVGALAALVVSLICLAATLELFAQMSSSTGRGNIGNSRPMLLEALTKSLVAQHPSTIGLPQPQRSDDAWYVLFVSTGCSTCRTVLADLAGNALLSLYIVVLGVEFETARDWIREQGLEPDDVLLNADQELLMQAGLIVTPSVLVVIDHEIAFVAGVATLQAVREIVVEKHVPPLALSIRAGVPTHDDQI
jgi:hypothetical protein